MSMRYPGGFIASTPVTAAYPSGVWTQAQAIPYQAQNVWTRDQYWPYTTLLLQGNGTNGAQNNTFLDSSTNNFTITRNGNTTQGSFTPYEQDGYWSNYFNGSTDYLTAPNNTALDIASGDFTVEAWFFPTSFASGSPIIGRNNGNFATQNDFQYGVYLQAGGNVVVRPYQGSITDYTTVVGVAVLNSWNHVAFVRTGNTFYGFLNGVRGSTSQTISGALNTGSWVTYIGSSLSLSLGNSFFTGYISNARVVKGTALYISSFTPSTAPLTAITNTSLLTCQSNRFKDNSTNAFAITVNGSPSVQAFQPFPGATTYSGTVLGGSGYFDGAGDYLSDIGTTSSFNFMHNTTALFTFECWVFLPSTAAAQTLIDNTNGTSSQIGISLSITAGGNLEIYITRGVTGVGNVTAYITSTGVVPTNQWAHIAITYNQSLASNNGNFYINGASAGSGNKTGNTPSSSNASNAMRIGTFGAGAGNFVNGYISNLRISNSIIYSSAFTPPTTPVTGGTLLTNFTNPGIFDAAVMNDLETVGNAQVSTSVVKYGTGSMAFDGSGDYLFAANNPGQRIMGGDFTVEMWMYLGAAQANMGLVSSYENNNGWIVRLDTTYIRFFYGISGSGTANDVTYSFSPGVWYHIAWVKSGASLSCYINGTQQGSTFTVSGAVDTTTAGMQVGRTQTTSNDFNGYIDDLRITKGAARYITNFTPPPARMPGQ